MRQHGIEAEEKVEKEKQTKKKKEAGDKDFKKIFIYQW